MTTFPPFHLPFIFYHSHSTSLPFLSLFLALSSSSSPFSYKQQPHSSLQNTPMGRDKPSSFSSPSHIIFSILQYLGFSRLQGGEQLFTPSPPAINHHHHHHHHLGNLGFELRAFKNSRVRGLRVLHVLHMVYFNLIFNYSF